MRSRDSLVPLIGSARCRRGPTTMMLLKDNDLRLNMSSYLKENNTAVITGASSGIGRAAAMNFAARGMNVWMVDVDAEELHIAKQLVESKRKNESQVLIN
jgi:NADPH:quinone reductase-like Zn-dependent oxidoreductase